MSLTTRALWVIDRNLARDLSLGAIARACGVSRHHLAHAFGQATGWPVMAYVRARRLTEAAQALADGAEGVLGVALDAGYASHEAFTRAFTARFGVNPEEVRRRASTDGLPLVPALKLADPPPPTAARLRIERAGEILAVGLREPAGFGAPEAIVAQWRRFGPEFAAIPLRRQIPIGVMTPVDETGRFDYVCAAEVLDLSPAPPDLARLRIAARTYAVFTHAGHVTGLGATYAAIWDRWLVESGLSAAAAASLERHHPTFDPRSGEGGVDIWIPLDRAPPT